MSRSFFARYRGQCKACEEWFPEGTPVVYNLDDQIVHITCPDNNPEAPQNTKLCNKCFTFHNGECP
jgi:hypothetical protein